MKEMPSNLLMAALKVRESEKPSCESSAKFCYHMNENKVYVQYGLLRDYDLIQRWATEALQLFWNAFPMVLHHWLSWLGWYNL